MTNERDNGMLRERIARVVGVLYIVLMTLHITLPFRASLEDVLVPIMFCLLLPAGKTTFFPTRKHLLEIFQRYPLLLLLLAYLGVTFFATLFHFLLGGQYTLASAFFFAYECGVFVYCAVVFVFYIKHPLPSRIAFWLGCGILAAMLFGWILFQTGLVPSFGFQSQQMEGTAMSFLSKRYVFTLGNPNFTGSFFALPLALACGGWLAVTQKTRALVRQGQVPATNDTRSTALFALLLVFSLPCLAFTMSKHALMGMAVVCGLLGELFRPHLPRLSRFCWVPVLLAGLFCETTVLYTTFPLKNTPPFLNTTPGMYTIHQLAYAKMVQASLPKNILGLGPQKVVYQYPQFVDRPRAERILHAYNAEQQLDGFCNFMDPHNEYLNQLALFGPFALALLLAFWLSFAKHAPDSLAVAFVLAVLFCMLWDDILSKRWLWTTAAFLLAKR
ncbi:MAG: hypothetical protein IJJ26_06115 [Victivallales bacterium]|nr:hypothetical protein [Victivallales bacterium]